MRRFNQAQIERDEICRSLERRVEERTAEPKRSHEENQRAQAERVLVVERERIMRDAHDGVGSQLIVVRELACPGALSQEELVPVFTECSDDLMHVIDSRSRPLAVRGERQAEAVGRRL